MITMIAIDMSHNKGYPVYDGSQITVYENIENIPTNDLILVEAGVKTKLLQETLKTKVLYCNGRYVKRLRDSLNIPKTDENDAKLIFDLYTANPEHFHEIYYPTGNLAMINRQYKNRMSIIKARTKLKNRINAYEKEQANLDEIKILESNIKQLDKSEKLVISIMEKFIPSEIINEFDSICGVGKISIINMIGGLGDVSRFKSRDAFLRYVGLVPNFVERDDDPDSKFKKIINPYRVIFTSPADNCIRQKHNDDTYYKIYEEYRNKIGHDEKYSHHRARRRIATIIAKKYYKFCKGQGLKQLVENQVRFGESQL